MLRGVEQTVVDEMKQMGQLLQKLSQRDLAGEQSRTAFLPHFVSPLITSPEKRRNINVFPQTRHTKTSKEHHQQQVSTLRSSVDVAIDHRHPWVPFSGSILCVVSMGKISSCLLACANLWCKRPPASVCSARRLVLFVHKHSGSTRSLSVRYALTAAAMTAVVAPSCCCSFCDV